MPEYVIGLTGEEQERLLNELRYNPPYGKKMVRAFRIVVADVVDYPGFHEPIGFVGPCGEGM